MIEAKKVHGCFRKRTGSFVYLRLSEDAVRILELDPTLVYGVAYNGNIARVKPDTMVEEMSIQDMLANQRSEDEWNANMGVKEGVGNEAVPVLRK